MKKVLCWSDAAVTSTGFGVVSKYVLRALHDTGEYDIEHLAINYHGDFVDKNAVPWQMVPAKTMDPNDPYGNKMFIRALQERDYDYVWIMNDTFVVEEAAKAMVEVFKQRTSMGRSNPIVVYYYPVDCRILKTATSMIKLADVPVAYTDFGIQETLKTLPELGSIPKIHHGTNVDVFKPLPIEAIQEARQRYFRIDGDTTLIINVNRNSQRKQLAQTIMAFYQYRKINPNSMLYLHTNIVDGMSRIDLNPFLDQLGLSTQRDVIFPVNYNPAKGLTESMMNVLYNCADMFLTTHAGEGWGLSVTEAMAACVPVVAPYNTSMPEILGTNSERGELYPCKEVCSVDNSGYRMNGRMDDIIEKMVAVQGSGFKFGNPKVIMARQWVMQNSWANVTKQWVDLFANAKKKEVKSVLAETV